MNHVDMAGEQKGGYPNVYISTKDSLRKIVHKGGWGSKMPKKLSTWFNDVPQ